MAVFAVFDFRDIYDVLYILLFIAVEFVLQLPRGSGNGETHWRGGSRGQSYKPAALNPSIQYPKPINSSGERPIKRHTIFPTS